MYLGLYRFDGNREKFLVAYDKLLQNMPLDNLHLHVCVSDEKGISIYDACPTREIFEAFSNSPDMQEALKSAGLPKPEINQIGEVHAAFLGGKRMI